MLSLVLIYVVWMHLIEPLRWIGALCRGLRRQEAAIVVNQSGIVDNASEYGLGQLTWREIEKMYPWDCKTRLFGNRWSRMPVISRQRGIAVIVKDGIDLRRLLPGKPWLTRLLMRQWYISGRGRWLFIPEMALTVTADEVMAQLNRFYTAEVRGAA